MNFIKAYLPELSKASKYKLNNGIKLLLTLIDTLFLNLTYYKTFKMLVSLVQMKQTQIEFISKNVYKAFAKRRIDYFNLFENNIRILIEHRNC